MTSGALVLAWHACDVTVRDRLVKGELATLKPSRGGLSDYDWLGNGVYFFENDQARAEAFAHTAVANPQHMLTRQPIANPAVVGAVLCVHNWVDLCTQDGIANFKAGLSSLKASQREQNKPMPTNKHAYPGDETILLRHLDCAAIDMMHKVRKAQGLPEAQAVRGAFYQGATLAETSEFRELTHIQLALREPKCIKAWFLPPGQSLLTEAQLAAADADLQYAIHARHKEKRERGKKKVS